MDEQVQNQDSAAQGTDADARERASEVHRRERQAFGGAIQWEAAFFGWLAAIGLSAMLVSIVVGAGLAVGITEIGSPRAEQAKPLTIGGGVVIFVILAVAYLTGGYVAARMARFDGWRQGLGVWILGVVATIGLALAGLIGGSDYNVLATLDLPRIPVDEGELTTGGAIALGTVAFGTLAAAFAGGVAGERFHRTIDRAGEAPEAVEPAEEPAEEPRAEGDEEAVGESEGADRPAEPADEDDPEATRSSDAKAEGEPAPGERSGEPG